MLGRIACWLNWHSFPQEWNAKVVHRDPDAVEVWRSCRRCGVKHGNVVDDHPLLDGPIRRKVWLSMR
jgi:hypothetical protein